MYARLNKILCLQFDFQTYQCLYKNVHKTKIAKWGRKWVWVREYKWERKRKSKNKRWIEKKCGLWSGNVTSDLIGHEDHYHAITKRKYLHLICYSFNICYLSRFQNQFIFSVLSACCVVQRRHKHLFTIFYQKFMSRQNCTLNFEWRLQNSK